MLGIRFPLKSVVTAMLIVVQSLVPFVHAHAGESDQTGFHVHLVTRGDTSARSPAVTNGQKQGDEVTIASTLPRNQKEPTALSGVNDDAPLYIDFTSRAYRVLLISTKPLLPDLRSVTRIFDREGPPPPKHAPPVISV